MFEQNMITSNRISDLEQEVANRTKYKRSKCKVLANMMHENFAVSKSVTSKLIFSQKNYETKESYRIL